MERYYNDGTEPTILPHLSGCVGPCKQGRCACPHPDACLLPDQEDGPPLDREGAYLLVLSIIAAWVAVIAAFMAARWLWTFIAGGDA